MIVTRGLQSTCGRRCPKATRATRATGYESFKQLVLAILNGKAVKAGWAPALRELAEECRVIREALAEQHPQLVEGYARLADETRWSPRRPFS